MSHGNNIYTVWHPELEKNIEKLAISAIYIYLYINIYICRLSDNDTGVSALLLSSGS